MPTYRNESPLDNESIDSDTGILVIAFDPENPNDVPSVSYYSSQVELENGWQNGTCPLTRKPKYMAVPLSELINEQLASLVAEEAHDDNLALLADGGFNNFKENSFVRTAYTEYLNNIKAKRKAEEDEHVRRAASEFGNKFEIGQEIERILGEFQGKIAEIGIHHEQARLRAQKLCKELRELNETMFVAPANGSSPEFRQEAKRLIDEAMPVLERDLGWGDLLTNLLKKLYNVVRDCFPRAQQGFFTIQISDAARDAGELNTQLERIEEIFPRPK